MSLHILCHPYQHIKPKHCSCPYIFSVPLTNTLNQSTAHVLAYSPSPSPTHKTKALLMSLHILRPPYQHIKPSTAHVLAYSPSPYQHIKPTHKTKALLLGAQWLSGRVLDSRPKGRGFEPHRRHCVVSLSKTHLS